ncbi:DinB family protein [Fimbriiglobus ruber]|nr:DinB family protein [Fimbriiglobus ruber]
MPISAAFAESNRTQTERLRKLVGRLDDAMLAARQPNGWTVAVALAHLAFWDRQRLCLMRRWAAGNWCNGGYDGELFNETLLPFLEMIPPARAAEVALRTAEEVDAFLLSVPDEVVAAALARPDRPNLDRGSHREGHLDQIEQTLAAFSARAES